MTGLPEFSLSSRVMAINGVVFALGTAVLAFSPATVSSRALLSEGVVLLVGLTVMVVGNGFLVRAALRPLDRLADQLDRARAVEPLERVPAPQAGITRRLATAVNDLIGRIEAAQREGRGAALTAQESESARIAQDLHDGVGQSLTAMMLELGVLADQSPPPLRDQLVRLREGARGSLDEVRGVARRLRPDVLEDLGLRSALVALTTDLFGNSTTHVSRGIAPGLPVLDESTELVVFRVAQEALTNVAKHAGARSVQLLLGVRGEWVELTVGDDGRGVGGAPEGTGLRGMRERAALVGGTLTVNAREGGGTVVTLAVPASTR